jgi:hypothetical protein
MVLRFELIANRAICRQSPSVRLPAWRSRAVRSLKTIQLLPGSIKTNDDAETALVQESFHDGGETKRWPGSGP